MIGPMFVALSGMTAHEFGLKVISNNVANMNTAGFRGSTVSFGDVFIGSSPSRLGGQPVGSGVGSSRSQVDFRSGDPQQTGRELDLFLNGAGFFVLENERGEVRYTRDGRFDFNDAGEMVALGQNLKVMTRNASGVLVPVTLGDLRLSQAKATTQVDLDGILSSGDADGKATIDSVTVFDAEGGKHTLKLEFTKDAAAPTSNISVKWNIKIFEGTTEVGTGAVEFFAGDVVAGSNPLELTLALGNGNAVIRFDFSTVEGGSFGDNTNLTLKKQDGFAAGAIATRTFDEKGVLKLTYTNGQTADGATLALARISDQASLVQLSNAQFAYRGTAPVELRTADDDLVVQKGLVEGANVALTNEFTRLILMQRGYQASSQVISTANEMLQQLFDLRGRR